MHRGLMVAATLAALLTCGGVLGYAMAGDDLLDPEATLAPSPAAELLPPITIEGRRGWACAAERSATAPTTQDADLPTIH
jgi:hypothetical protein